jgi:uncharacterized protein (TIGR02246 family)
MFDGLGGPMLARALVFALVLGACVHQADRSGSEAQIRQRIALMTEAFNAHDAHAQASFFAEDADFVSARGLRWRGAAEIERGLAGLFATSLRQARLEMEEVEVRVIRDDLAIAHVRNRLSGRLLPDGQTAPPHEEISVRVFDRSGGDWRIAAFHNTLIESR